jgi:hypothetical protein
MKASKKRRGSFLKIRKGRGKGATYYLVDTYKNDEVLHQGIRTLKEAEGMFARPQGRGRLS